MPKLRLCKDCKHLFDIEGEAMCDIPQEWQTHDLVLGTVTHSQPRNPYTERSRLATSQDRCGTQGKYWEEA